MSQLAYCDSRPYQMLVPDLCYTPEYKKKYEYYCLDYRYFVILDNGAYETVAMDDSALLRMACDYKVDEVIAPDTMRDAAASLLQLDEFMALWRHPSYRHRRPDRVMAVVQGTSIEQCQSMVHRIATDHPQVATLGIPKHLPKTTGIPIARLELADWIQNTYPSYAQDIHFLGFTHDGEVEDAAEIKIRSLDTSIPFVAARENMTLAHCAREGTPFPDRQRWYANLWSATRAPHELISHNIRTLDDWARASTKVEVSS